MGHRVILGEAWLYNLLLPDHSPAVSKMFRSAGLLSSASKSVKRSGVRWNDADNGKIY
jgi:hypothetical protein